ncbi:MAG: OmpA family protein [Gammaproteobacteria bacterium]|nr:OmpA family protein [Gammaproteobacteria bacterium]
MTCPKLSRWLFASLPALVLSTFPVLAETPGSNNYINAAVGLEDFDNDRQLSSRTLISLGFEHRYDQNWAAEVFLADSSPRIKGSTENIDLTQFGLDAIYYFDTYEGSNIQPYGALGIGHSDFDADSGSNEETQARVGLGFRYLLDDHWSFRGDTRLLYSEESHTIDNTLSVGLSYAFNPQKAEPKPVAVVVEKDSDSDGVVDSADQCPGSPAGVAVDSNGCVLDSDNDGVADYKDNCPATGAGILVDGTGCPLDGDNDGVADHKDQCPESPAGAAVDSLGCELDSDNDGVVNSADKCPATPQGRQVDADGCKFVLKTTEELRININFASNSSNVSEDQYVEIEKVAEFLKKFGGVSTVIEGHTDDRGSADYNQKLSQARANAVRNVLIERYGIAAGRVSAAGFGESQPIQSNDSSAGRLANRRVVAVMQAQVVE